MRFVVSMFAVAALAVQAQAQVPAGVHVWKAADIAAKGKSLSQKLDAQKVASEVIAKDGNRRFMVAHREGSGIAEWHEKEADIMIISAGNVTLIYGGKVVGGKQTEPGEIRGPSIQGGTQVVLGAGDVFQIPAKVPHQMKLAAGAQLTYFVVKVIE